MRLVVSVAADHGIAVVECRFRVGRHILVSTNSVLSDLPNGKQRHNRISHADSCRCFFSFSYQVNDWLLAAARMISAFMQC